MIIDLHDVSVPAEARECAKIAFVATRLPAKKAYEKQGGNFDELITYTIYDFSDETDASIHVHTPPLPITDKIERRKVFTKYSAYHELDEDEPPFDAEIGHFYLVANYGSSQPKIIDFTEEFISEESSAEWEMQFRKVLDEVAMLDTECRPVRLQSVRKSRTECLKPRKKLNLIRAAVREIIPNSSSSSDEQADSKKLKTHSHDDEAQKSSKKPLAPKSKHQGKAKTFKRKTQRRGRV